MIGIIAFVLLRKDEPESSVQLSESTISPEKVDQPEHEVIQVEEVRSSDSSVSVLISRTENFPTIQVEENFVQQLDPATLQPLPKMDSRPTEAIENQASESKDPVIEKSNLRIYHIEDYKVFDYRGLRSAIEKPEPYLGGTPASGVVDNNEQQHHRSQKVTYVKFLESAITKYSKGEYELALNDFNAILDTYPDDVNAQFYAGMCMFNKRAYDRAATLFSLSEANSVAMFVDESQWYRAKSYYYSGKKAKAEELLESIISKKGFYSTQASKFLEESLW